MTLDVFLLISLTLTTLIGFPVYFFFREKMVEARDSQNYSRNRIIKIVLINVLLTITVAIQLFGIFIALLLRSEEINSLTIILGILFILISFLVFYGAGIYVTAITVEAFTKTALTKHKSYSRQRIALEFLHGPASHLLVYGGAVLSLFILSLLDFARPGINNELDVLVPIGLGALTGVFYALAQVYSKTYAYQFILVSICSIVLLFIIFFSKDFFTQLSIFPYFTSFCFVSFIIIGYLVYKNILKAL